MSYSLFVGALSSNTTEASLTDYFSQFGEIEKVILVKDPKTSLSKGFGFVNFVRFDSLYKVLAHRPHCIDEKIIDCQLALNKTANKAKVVVSPNDTSKLYRRVRIITRDKSSIKVDEIIEYFRDIGAKITEIEDQENTVGSSKHVLHVGFESQEVAKMVIAMKDHNVKGSLITCEPDPQNIDGPGKNQENSTIHQSLFGDSNSKCFDYDECSLMPNDIVLSDSSSSGDDFAFETETDSIGFFEEESVSSLTDLPTIVLPEYLHEKLQDLRNENLDCSPNEIGINERIKRVQNLLKPTNKPYDNQKQELQSLSNQEIKRVYFKEHLIPNQNAHLNFSIGYFPTALCTERTSNLQFSFRFMPNYVLKPPLHPNSCVPYFTEKMARKWDDQII